MKPYNKPGGPSQVAPTQSQATATPVQQVASLQEANPHSALSFLNIQSQSVAGDSHHSLDTGSGSKAVAQPHNVQFSAGQAIIWQIKFIVNCYLNKKTSSQASLELQLLSEKFGTDFDRFLFRELIEQIDLNDPNKALKDKNEAIKSQLLNQELTRASAKPQFLTYFGEIADALFNGLYSDFLAELVRRLKLGPKMSLLIALSLSCSCKEASRTQCNTMLKAKMVDYLGAKTTEVLEEYAVHRISFLQATDPDFSESQMNLNPKVREAIRHILSDHASSIRPSQSVALRLKATSGDLICQNPSGEEPSNALIRNGTGLEHLQWANRFLEPWEVLLDLGHYTSFNYQQLIMALQDFKDFNERPLTKLQGTDGSNRSGQNERTMANMILQLSLQNTGQDTSQSRIVLNAFEANKLGDPQVLRKEPSDKNTTLQWQVGNFARAFREIYSNLSYYKVFESFADLSDGLDPDISLDTKAYATLLQLFNKSKPQNLQLPVALILDGVWKSPSLQLSFVKNAIRCYTSNEDKTFTFAQSTRKIPAIPDLVLNSQATPELIDVWSQPEVIECLLRLSRTQYPKVRELFDAPLKLVPEHLLLTLSKCNITHGSLLIDELLSTLMPQFLGHHTNSIAVLKKLWEFNQQLMIRAICELCSPDHKVLNLSRVLDITQEIKDSLIKIVYCQDYDFAVKLCILAGKREFFHYDVWLKERIKGVGAPFVKALVKYINEEIIIPCKVEMIKQGIHANKQLTQAQLDALEDFKEQVLERSHLSKERLCLTMENLENPANFQSLFSPPSFVQSGSGQANTSQQSISASNIQGQLSVSEKIISQDAQNQIKDLIAQYAVLFPRQVSPTQSSDEVEKAANEYFQHIFSAPPQEVDTRIQSLIVTMQNFRKSQVVKEQEIFACMLHCLFDEYRFLHRYPQQYLEKIAKLFGAIIKNKLLDSVLQDIALKFVIEAFRREGKRQSFGIIVIKEFFDCLPEFPKQFQDIYTIRDKVQRQDPQLYEDLGRLYAATLGNKDYEQTKDRRQEVQPVESQFLKGSFDGISESIQNSSSFALDDDPKKPKGQQSVRKFVSNFDEIANTSNPFQPNFAPTAQPTGTTFSQPQTKQTAAQPQRGKNQTAGQTKAQEPVKTANAQQESKQVPMFVPSQTVKAMNNTTATAAQKTMSNLSVNSASFTHSQSMPNTRAVSSDPTMTAPMMDQMQQKMPVQRIAASSQEQFKPEANLGAQTLADVSLNAKAFRPWEFTENQTQQPINPRGANQQLPNLNNFGPVDLNRLQSPFFTGTPQSEALSQSPVHSSELAQWLAIQTQIDQKILDAKHNKTRLRFEDLIEDTQQEMPNQDDQETIKFICNNTGKNNFEPKLEDLKQVVRPSEVNLKWFINYILTKRISVQYQKQQHIYIDLVRQLGITDSVSRTIKQAVEIFKKCMLVDEVEFNKVANKPVDNQQRSMLKQYLAALGSFIGAITLAYNTPIKRNDLDLKQLLLQGFYHEQRKIIIVFVCKILREAFKSTVFKIQNPWMNSLLQIIYEIFAVSQQSHLSNQDHDIIMEIESLFKLFNINSMRDITNSSQGHLQALQRQHPTNVSQQVELSYLSIRVRNLPVRQKQARPQDAGQITGGAYSREISQLHAQGEGQYAQQKHVQQPDHIVAPQAQQFFNSIQIAPEAMKLLTTKFNLTQDQIRALVIEAVDASIVDILGPVVDRSVTIALITTTQLVLKDFAFDGNISRVREAADQIVQNLAGSLALVTCREPLRISLQNNLLKCIKRTCQSAFEQEMRKGMSINQPELEARVEMYIADHEDDFQEIAQTASKENLDLGCKMIKKAVIEKALRKVREDPIMNSAIDKRERAAQSGVTNFVDEEIAKTMVELPPQLQPNRNGLDAAQFKVYSDFSKLNYRSRMEQQNLPNFTTGINQPNENFQGQKSTHADGATIGQAKRQEPAIYDFDLDKILSKIDKEGQLTSVTRGLLTLKLTQISKEAEQPQSNTKQVFQKLTDYCDDKLQKVCVLFESSPQEAQAKMEIVSMIVRKSLKQKLSIELLEKCYMQMEECYLLNAELAVQLMRHQIIDIRAWDFKFVNFVHESSGQLHEKASDFLTKFIHIAVLQNRFIRPEMIPNTVKLMEEFQTHKVSYLQTPSVRSTILQTMQEVGKLQVSPKEVQLKNLFHKWVELSYIDDSAAQEKEMNNYFSDLGALGIDQDRDMLYSFTHIMVKQSIDLSMYTKEGRRRLNNNTLDYRFIDSFIKLVVVLLKTFDFNKREFMVQIFDYIKQKLESDHKAMQGQFNQKPFYRMLMNILTAVNMSNCFTQKVQRQILFDIADLFQDLNPNNLPAFAFAWLELISHKSFMPHFIKRSGQSDEEKDPKDADEATQAEMHYQLLKQCKIKDLLVQSFLFLKFNMVPGQQVCPSLQSFYTAVLRILLVILKDYPQFLCDFHFNFVNSLPEHAIQLKNTILAAFPRNISPPSPLSQDLKVDTLQDVWDPKILSNFEAYLKTNGIIDDLNKFFQTKNFDLVPQICAKMMASKENINGRIIPNSSVINAVILYIVTQVCNEKKHGAPDSATKEKDNVELLKQMAAQLNDETRLCFLNSIVNELRYPNTHTFYFCMIVLILFQQSGAKIKEQISTILFERLQAHRPFPWGLMINFRELIQNTKYAFMRSEFIAQNQVAIQYLFKNRLRIFFQFIQSQQLQQPRHHMPMGTVSE